MNRVLVVGTTGSGKTTTAAEIARCLDIPHIELDALHWLPAWAMRPDEEFRALVDNATSGTGWVADGNYWSKIGEALWQRADTVVFLDLRLPLLLWRVLRRTIERSVHKTDLWEGNRETISSLWKKDSLLLWALKSYPKNRARYSTAIADPRWVDVTMVRLRSPRAVRRWLAELRAGAETA